MKFVPMPTLHTPRLILRHITMEDLQTYHTRLTSEPEVARYMLWQANEDLLHTEENIRRILQGYAQGKRYHWAIAQAENNSLIGTIALLGFDEEQNRASFAYMLGKDYWNLGYGTEALRAVFYFAFEQMEAESIFADHFRDNPASGAVMRKLGMHPVGILPGKYEKNGNLQDAIVYEILKKDWEPQNSIPNL